MKPKVTTSDLRVFMGWIKDYCDSATAPKTPEEMKKLVEEMYEVEVDDISDIQQFFDEQYDYEGFVGERVYYEED